MPLPGGFVLGMLSAETPVGSGSGTGVQEYLRRRELDQRNQQFGQEHSAQLARDAANRQASEHNMGIQSGHLDMTRRRFAAEQEAAKHKEAEAALAQWLQAQATGSADEQSLATQNLQRYMPVEQAQAILQEQQSQAAAPQGPPAAIANETDATRQLEQDAGLAGTLQALQTNPDGSPPGMVPPQAAPQMPQPPPAQPQGAVPPGFDVQPKPLPEGLQARPGEAPMGDPAPPMPPPPAGPFSRSFAAPQSSAPPQASSAQLPPQGPGAGATNPTSLGARMQAQGQPGEMVVRDPRTGQPIFRTNPTQRQANDVAMMDRTLDGLLAAANTDEEQRAAQAAKHVAHHELGQRGATPQGALDRAMEHYARTLGRKTAERVARGGRDDTGGLGGWGGEGVGLGLKDLKDLDTRQQAHIATIRQAYDLKGLTTQAQRANELKSLATSKTGTSQRAAVISMVKRLFGANPSDKETAFMMRSGGRIVELENEIRGYVDKGEISPELLRAIQEYANEASKLTNRARVEAAREVYNSIRNSPYFEGAGTDVAERFARNAVDVFSGGDSGGWSRKAGPRSESKKKPAAKQAASAAANEVSDEDLLNQLPE